MKNVQIIDGAENCEYAIFAFEDAQFELIFPFDGQNVEFIADVELRLSSEQMDYAFDGAWLRRVRKVDVQGIHGTLFYELEAKKLFYPSKNDEHMWNGFERTGGSGL